MKGKESEIMLSDETRLILDQYMKKWQNKREQRNAKKYGLGDATKAYVNPFQELIDKLEVIERLLLEKQTYEGDEVKIVSSDENRVKSAAKYVETAIVLLNTLEKLPK